MHPGAVISKMKELKVVAVKRKSFWKKMGPGLITGASDDDPSGIATYPSLYLTLATTRYHILKRSDTALFQKYI